MRVAAAGALFALAVLAPAAHAQFAEVIVPAKVSVAAPFYADVTLVCPPAGDGPPRQGCDGTTLAFFDVSDASARMPREALELFPNVPVRWGPIVLHKPGVHALILLSETLDFPGEPLFLGGAQLLVEPPGWSVRRRK